MATIQGKLITTMGQEGKSHSTTEGSIDRDKRISQIGIIRGDGKEGVINHREGIPIPNTQGGTP